MIPSIDSPLRLESSKEADAACDRFESEWRSGASWRAAAIARAARMRLRYRQCSNHPPARCGRARSTGQSPKSTLDTHSTAGKKQLGGVHGTFTVFCETTTIAVVSLHGFALHATRPNGMIPLEYMVYRHVFGAFPGSAHNLEVVGSNPTAATRKPRKTRHFDGPKFSGVSSFSALSVHLGAT